MHSKSKNRSSDTERRQFTRIPISFHVYFSPCGMNKEKLAPGGFPDYCYCSNINEKGMQLRFNHKPKEGEYLKIQITLPESQFIHILGQVVWFQYDKIKQVYTAGVQFVDLKDKEKREINNFIKRSLN